MLPSLLLVVFPALTQRPATERICPSLSGLVKDEQHACLGPSCLLRPSTRAEYDVKGLVKLKRGHSFGDASGSRDTVPLEACLALSVICRMSLVAL